MKRYIKFRGKRLDGSGWVYGSLIDYANHFGAVVYDPEPVKYVVVDPATVGQHTGCQDKYGTDVYEDDLVPVTRDGVTKYGRVVFHRGAFCIEHISGLDGSLIYALLADVFDPHEQIPGADVGAVAGNVHEKPELLSSGGTA